MKNASVNSADNGATPELDQYSTDYLEERRLVASKDGPFTTAAIDGELRRLGETPGNLADTATSSIRLHKGSIAASIADRFGHSGSVRALRGVPHE